MRFFSLLLVILFASQVFAQRAIDSVAIKNAVDSINRLLDRSVVSKDTGILKKHYADDFFFLHATGRIDSKESWLRGIQNPNNVTVSREHDSTAVELHGDVAIVTGLLSVRFPKGTRNGYAIRYLRVFAYRSDRWQLLSHHSSGQWLLKDE